MENAPVQAHALESAESGGFESESPGLSAAPPTLQLTASAADAPIQRQEPTDGEGETEVSEVLQQLQTLYAAEDQAPFWEYVHNHRDEIQADAAATAWVDENVSTVDNWRVDTVVDQGAYASWTDARKLELATLVRSKFPEVATVREFVQDEFLPDETKLNFLGQLRALIGQAEYLMGAIFHGPNASFESSGSNSGPFVDEYHDQTGFTWAQDAWCTMFVGYTHLLTGFREDVIRRDGMMWSNYRLDVWQENGVTSSGSDSRADPGDYDNYSGSTISHTAFQGLYDSLVTHHDGSFADDAAKEADLDRVFDEFFAANVTPIPGDAVIINNSKGRDNNDRDHTVMVETYDSDSHTISTVEGNSSNRVRGRQIRMEEDPRTGASTNVGNLYSLVRAGLEFFQDPATADQEQEEEATPVRTPLEQLAGTIGGLVDGLNLLVPLQGMVEDLRNMAQAEAGVGAGTTVAEMSNPNNEAGTTR